MMKVWTAFLVIGAAASVVAWLVALCHENRLGAIGALMRQMRRMPKFGRFVLGVLFMGMWLYGSVKQSGGVESGGVGELGGNHGMYGIDGMGTNLVFGRVESVEGVDNVANEDVLPVANANTQLGSGNIGTGNTSIMATLESSLRSSASLRLCVENNNGLFDFMVPSNAVVCEDWRAFGAYEDWFYLTDDKWSFRFGSNFVKQTVIIFNAEAQRRRGTQRAF